MKRTRIIGRAFRWCIVRSAHVILVTGLLLAAPFTPSAWRYRKPIRVAPSEGVGVVRVDRDVYLGARPDLSDLRVVRDGQEIPFVLETLSAASGQRERRAEILDQSIANRSGASQSGAPALQFVLRLDENARHNRVRLETGERNFRQTVHIETSEDGKTWSLARDDGAIFDFSEGERRLSVLTVDYPVSTRRYLRVTVLGWTKVKSITGAYVDFQEQRAASRETLATLTPHIVQNTGAQTTLVAVDVGASGLPVDHIGVVSTSPAFHRAVAIEASDDGVNWDYLSQGVLARLPQGSTSQDRAQRFESLSVAVPETRRRYLRLRIYNRDDRPIVIQSVILEGLIRRVTFLMPVAGSYWLYYGNPATSLAGYDLPVLLAHRASDQGVNAKEIAFSTDPQQANPAYHPFQPWSERHPAILYTVLGAAILGLGSATLRFAFRLRQPPQTP